MKRIISIFLISLSLLLLFSTAIADEDTTPRASNYFSSYGISLSALGSGDFSFTMNCASQGTASQLGVSSYSIHKYTDAGWLVVASGSGSYRYNTSSYALSKTFNGVAGEQYRVKCTFLCNKSDGTGETKTYTSRTITAN